MSLEQGHALRPILLPVAEALGVGIDVRLGQLLLPPGWQYQLLPSEAAGAYRRGERVSLVRAGGYQAAAPLPRSSAMAAIVVLAAEMWQASEGGHFTLVTYRALAYHSVLPGREELGGALLAASSLLLADGWVVDLQTEDPRKGRA